MIKHISDTTAELRNYLDGRRKGYLKSWKTGYDKLDSSGIDGIEWGSTIAIAGRPSVGKSIFSDLIIKQGLDANPRNYDILDFSWEMSTRVQLTRKLAGDMHKSYANLCSAGGYKLNDSDMSMIDKRIELYNGLPIYFEEEPKTPAEFIETIEVFHDKRKEETGDKDRKIIIKVDHALLTKGASEDKRVAVLLDLMGKSNVVKKKRNAIFIFLIHLNREIEDRQEDGNDRAFPKQADVFGGDAVAFFSETMILLNNPSKYNISYYGKRPNGKTVEDNDLFAHIVKNRNGEPNLVVHFKTNFAQMLMEEM